MDILVLFVRICHILLCCILIIGLLFAKFLEEWDILKKEFVFNVYDISDTVLSFNCGIIKNPLYIAYNFDVRF